MKKEVNKKKRKNIKYKHIAILTFFMSILLLCSLSTISAANQTIAPGDNGGIRGAITNTSVNNGDTIFLQPGTYNKTGNDTNFTISKNITLQGNGSTDSVIIDAQGLSRIFTIGNGYNVTFINISFINANATGNGGAIYNNFAGTAITFVNCTFTNNTATIDGGAIYNIGNANLSDCNFIINKARYGGAIRSEGNLTISDCNFTSNNAANYGGGIYNSRGNLTVSDCDFISNNASNGAAICLIGAANMTVSDCDFISNNAANYGGAISNSNSTASIFDCNFIDNNADIGGAIYNTIGSNVSVSDCSFTHNNAINHGGAISNSNSANLNVSDCNFTNNNASVGGAISNLNSASLNVSDCDFTSNKAGNGGAIRNAANMTVSDCDFISNNASSYGGAIYNTVNGTVSDCNFISNNANLDGGAIISRNGANFTVFDCDFISNNASRYGGGISNQGDMFVSGNTMVGNVASLGQMIYNVGTMGVLNLIYLNNCTVTTSKGSLVTLYATLTDDMGNNVTGQEITFYVNGAPVGLNTSLEGKSNVTFTVPNISGVIPVSGDYLGRTGYSMDLLNGELLIKINTNLTIDVPENVTVGQEISITGSLTDEDGNPIPNANITVTIGGKDYNVSTDENGNWILPYIPYNAGELSITTVYQGNDSYGSSNANDSLNIVKITTNITIDISGNIKVGENTTLKSKLTDENGNPIAGATVDFYIDGKKIGSAVTDSNGIAKLKYSFTKAGNYNIQAKFAGNDTYLGSSATTQTTVSKIKTKMTIEKDGDKIIVTLTDEDGNPLEGKEITLRDSKGRVIGFGIANKNGQVIFTYTGNEIYFKASFDGDDIFKGVDAKFKITKDNNNPTNDNSVATTAAMKDTGMPIIAVLLVLLSLVGVVFKRK